MAGILNIQVITPSMTAIDLNPRSESVTTGTPLTALSRATLDRLANQMQALAAGTNPGGAVVRICGDDSTGVKATNTFTLTYASIAAADYVTISDGKGRFVKLTCVTTTPVLGDGTWQKTVDAATTAASLRDCILNYPGCIGWVTASASTNVVTVTAVTAGAIGNTYGATTSNGTGTAVGAASFSGGKDGGGKSSLTATLGGALSNNDTVTIGNVVLTGKTVAPSGQSQFLCGVSAAADGAALVACINAHTGLKGSFLASGTSTVTIQCRERPLVAALITITKSAVNITLSASTFANTTTDVNSTGWYEIQTGAVIT